jgi:hypothetical protein
MPQSTAVVIASAGTVSLSPGQPVSFAVSWGDNIGYYRWSRIWPAVQSAADEDTHQTVTVVSEGSHWETPASSAIVSTIRGDGVSGAPVVALIQVMCSQEDTF